MIWLLAIPYVLASAVAVTYGLHLLVLGVRALRRQTLLSDAQEPTEWPSVTVQLPVYDEAEVVERLIDAACCLDYPHDRFEVQVLDDSPEGDARQRAAARVAWWRSQGVAVEHVRRNSREGFKAGALAHGMSTARGELLCVFDADFVPAGDFLRRTVPTLTARASVGLVQARWAHLNEHSSALTRVQAAVLDVHFAIEQAGRQAAGLFVSFNGTAGVWRRTCIEAAGGWRADTLTEDLDLSYRAQLAGWQLQYLPSVSVPGELPPTADSLRVQQSRWTKGTAETAFKLGGALARARLPVRVRAAGALHLGSFLVHPALVIVALAHGPLRLLTPETSYGMIAWGAAGVLGGLALSGVVVAHLAAARALGMPTLLRFGLVPAILAVPAGLAVRNTRAVLEAVRRRRTPFVRTPKAGAALSARGGSWTLEAVFGAFAAAAAAALALEGHALAAMFQSIFAAGALWLAAHDSIARMGRLAPSRVRRAQPGAVPRVDLHRTLPSVSRHG